MSINLWGGVKAGASGTVTKRQTVDKNVEVMSEFRAMFEAQKESAAKVESKDKDTITISHSGNITQKLEELKKIHQQTDYSEMIDVEKYRVITDRYDEVFPCIDGKLETNYETYEPVARQMIEELAEIIPGYPHADKYRKENYTAFLKEVRGYQGLSNTELVEKTKERYSKTGAITEKVQVMRELWGLGVIDGESYGIFTASLKYLERQQYKSAFNVVNVDEQSESYKNWLKNGGMENLKIGWKQLRDNLFQNIDVKKLYGEEKERELEEIFGVLGGK